MFKITLFIIYFFNGYFLNAAETGSSLGLSFGLIQESSSLQSQAFSAEQPYALGNIFLINYRKNYIGNDILDFQNQSQSYFEISQSIVKHKPDASLAPSEVEHKEQQIRLQYYGKTLAIEDTNIFRLGIGYTGLFNKSTQTSPNVLFIDTEIHLVDLLIRWDFYQKYDLNFTIDCDLGLPFRYKEFTVQSGLNLSATLLKIGLSSTYQVNEKWALNASLKYQRLQMSADGSGSRGTINVNETRDLFQLPIGVNYDF